ncbi:MAG: HNH endonuclease, partial [Ilumatobacteraceae bacterium]
HGGPTDTCNLIGICPADHRLHHQGLLGITGNADHPDGLTFTDGHGRPIDPAAHPTKPTGPPPDPDQPYQHPLGERMEHWCITFPDQPAA